MINGLVGTIIWTSNLGSMTEFYRDVMEFPVHSVRPDFVVFEWGKFRFNIGTHDRVVGKTKEPERIMLNLDTSDIQNTYELLKQKGVIFIRSPEQEHWGGWVATFHDVDGNILQLLEQPA